MIILQTNVSPPLQSLPQYKNLLITINNYININVEILKRISFANWKQKTKYLVAKLARLFH